MDPYPERFFVPLITTASTDSSITISGLVTELRRSTQNPNGNQAVDEGIVQIFSNLNTLHYHQTADDTDFDTTFAWTPPVTGMVDKMFFNICLLLHVTALSSNGVTFDAVSVEMQEQGTETQLFRGVFQTGFAQATSDEDVDVFVLAEAVADQRIRVRAGATIDIRVRTHTTQVATNTFEMGLVDLFPLTLDTDSKFLNQSGIAFYITRDYKQ